MYAVYTYDVQYIDCTIKNSNRFFSPDCIAYIYVCKSVIGHDQVNMGRPVLVANCMASALVQKVLLYTGLGVKR